MKPPVTVSDIGEEALIRRIDRLVDPPPGNGVGIGDDAAVIKMPASRQVLTVDAQVEGTHFRRTWATPEAVGWKSLAVNLSDVAAMGARPMAALVSLILPADIEVRAVEGLYRGMRRLARREQVSILGGNLARGDQVSVTVTLIGRPLGRRPLLRSGARVGDRILVTGQPGLADLGLRALKRFGGKGDLWRAEARRRGRQQRDRFLGSRSLRSAVARFLRPDPRTAAAVALLAYKPSALIDTSDGLSRDLGHLSRPGCTPVIDAAHVPLARPYRSAVDDLGLNPLEAALAGGEDYELLFTLPPRSALRLLEDRRLAGVPVHAIGVMEDRRNGVYLRRGAALSRLDDASFAHF